MKETHFQKPEFLLAILVLSGLCAVSFAAVIWQFLPVPVKLSLALISVAIANYLGIQLSRALSGGQPERTQSVSDLRFLNLPL
jgi:hypothetical protein